jgi:hypothetical protein
MIVVAAVNNIIAINKNSITAKRGGETLAHAIFSSILTTNT